MSAKLTFIIKKKFSPNTPVCGECVQLLQQEADLPSEYKKSGTEVPFIPPTVISLTAPNLQIILFCLLGRLRICFLNSLKGNIFFPHLFYYLDFTNRL